MKYMESHNILREYHGAAWSLYGPMHGIPWKFSWVDMCTFHGVYGTPWNSTSYYGHHGIPRMNLWI